MRRYIAAAILGALLPGCGIWRDEARAPSRSPALPPAKEEVPTETATEKKEPDEEGGRVRVVLPTVELLSDSDRYRVILRGEPVTGYKIYDRLEFGETVHIRIEGALITARFYMEPREGRFDGGGRATHCKWTHGTYRFAKEPLLWRNRSTHPLSISVGTAIIYPHNVLPDGLRYAAAVPVTENLLEKGNELALEIFPATEGDSNGPVGIIGQEGCDDGGGIPRAVLDESGEVHLSVPAKYEIRVWLFIESPEF